LRERYGLQTALFTGAHLTDIRERIRIGGRPGEEAVFAQAYWKVRAIGNGWLLRIPDNRMDCQLFTRIFSHDIDHGLLHIHCTSPQVKVWILEVGMGGRYDACCWDMIADG
jgi:folylpolyglutamate synthase/dihydropteroate synthase